MSRIAAGPMRYPRGPQFAQVLDKSGKFLLQPARAACSHLIYSKKIFCKLADLTQGQQPRTIRDMKTLKKYSGKFVTLCGLGDPFMGVVVIAGVLIMTLVTVALVLS